MRTPLALHPQCFSVCIIRNFSVCKSVLEEMERGVGQVSGVGQGSDHFHSRRCITSAGPRPFDKNLPKGPNVVHKLEVDACTGKTHLGVSQLEVMKS